MNETTFHFPFASRGIDSLRVLVVEDEIRLADNIAIAFRDGPGFAIEVSHDGEGALLMCETTDLNAIPQAGLLKAIIVLARPAPSLSHHAPAGGLDLTGPQI